MVRIGEKTATTMPAVASAHTTAAISVNPPGTNRSMPPTTTGATAPNTSSSVSHTEETPPSAYITHVGAWPDTQKGAPMRERPYASG